MVTPSWTLSLITFVTILYRINLLCKKHFESLIGINEYLHLRHDAYVRHYNFVNKATKTKSKFTFKTTHFFNKKISEIICAMLTNSKWTLRFMSMDARKTISAVLGIRFPCVSLVLKVIDVDHFNFFSIKLLITIKTHVLSKN